MAQPAEQAASQEQLVESEPLEESSPVNEEESTPINNQRPVIEEAESAPQSGPSKAMRDMRLKAERADQLQRERDEAIQYAQDVERQIMRAMQQQQIPFEQEEPDYDYNNLDDDDLISAKDLKRSLASEQKKRAQLEAQMRQSQQNSYRTSTMANLKASYNDYDQVMSKENIAQLEQMRPGLARSLATNPDLAEMARETYNIIKDLGIYRAEQPSYSAPKKQIQANTAKPRSANSVSPQSGDTPLNKANMFANGLTAEVKAALWADMQKNRSWS
jgi:hypothetical protein